MAPNLRVGVDIGGTFTDIVIIDPVSNTTRTHKVLSTPKAPAVGMLQGLDETGVIKDTGFLVHGTTAGLNAILSGAGDRIALVTTDGFRDVLEIGRGENRDVWSLSPARRKLLVSPGDILTVGERLRHDGTVKTPLRSDDVTRVAQKLAEDGISSIAVCFLHAHKNPVHELEFRDLLKAQLPDVSVVLSHEISPEQGEYERTSSVVATAYVSRTIDTCLSVLQRELRARSCPAPSLRHVRADTSRQKHLQYPPLLTDPPHLDDHIDRVRQIADHVLEGEARAGGEDEQRQPLHRLAGCLRMDRGETARMTRVDRIEEGRGFRTPKFAKGDPVRPKAQGALQKRIG